MKDLAGTKINFKEVCYSCKHRDAYLDEDILYGDNRTIATAIVVGCTHEKVCKYYLEEKEED